MRDTLQVFKALSDETRLRILHLLQKQELCVCELVEILEMEQSRVSHQLQILKNARLVNDRRERKWIVYSLNIRDDDSWNRDVFRLLKTFLDKDEIVEEDERRLKLCLKSDVRERCHTLESVRK
ncbi:MAG: winged helix-turn-helix transcriptional regulator [Gemmatimonadota bacterium]|nr:MAG: winged helix-turn-helix transcriptional regulator [Gemmatimonadota bacterium]